MGYRTILGLDLGKFKSVCCAMRPEGVARQPGSFCRMGGT